MKLAILTDVHGNLPALAAALEVLNAESVDMIYHLGDAIAIGPFPAECVERLTSLPNIKFIMGNHDAYFVQGLPHPQPSWMSHGEVAHQKWIHQQLSNAHLALMQNWPYKIVEKINEVSLTLVHYALSPAENDFVSINRSQTASDFDKLFSNYSSDIILFGHDHRFADVNGRSRYINPGSLGCYNEPIARFTIIDIENGHFQITHRRVAYDDTPLINAFEAHQVPDRFIIAKIFFGGRFTLK